MAHMIMNEDSLFSVREKCWHGLGTIIQEAPNSEEALHLAGLDWKVIQTPIYYGDPTNANKLKTIEAEEWVANVRSDTKRILGVVTPKYKPIDNDKVFQFMDVLLDKGARFETAGSLENGKRVWMLAKLQPFNILGDVIDNYFFCANSHDGKSSLTAGISPIRICCNNTLNLALKTAKRSYSLKHMGEDINSKVMEATKALELNNKYTKALQEYANVLVEKKVSDSEFEKFLNELFPISIDDSNCVKANMTKLQNDFFTRYNAPDIRQFKNTEWGIVQSITDYAYHSAPLKVSKTFEEKRMLYALDGHPFVDKAIELLMKIPA
jgi:phage/plasmid-like protein (TIGR03299 family)